MLVYKGHYNLRKLIGGNCADKIKDHSSGVLADDSYHRYKVLYKYIPLISLYLKQYSIRRCGLIINWVI
jgi:hypothetical protein